MKQSEARITGKNPVWQTDWTSDYLQDPRFEKYALKTVSGELVALAAYEILENDVMVHITYIESHPDSNPTIVGHSKKYEGIGRVLIAYGSSFPSTMDAAALLRLKPRSRNWPSITSAILGPARFQALAVLHDMSCPVSPP